MAYTLITYSHSPSSIIKKIAKGRDNKLFSNTIETSLRDPDLVDFFASSMTRRRVSYISQRADVAYWFRILELYILYREIFTALIMHGSHSPSSKLLISQKPTLTSLLFKGKKARWINNILHLKNTYRVACC
jgi:hypothetical protein